MAKRKVVDLEVVQSLAEDQTYLSAHLVRRSDLAVKTLALGDNLTSIFETGLEVAGTVMTLRGLAGLPADTVSFWMGALDAPTKEAALFRGYVLRSICTALTEKGVADNEVRNLLGGYIAAIGSERLKQLADPIEGEDVITAEAAAAALVNDLMDW